MKKIVVTSINPVKKDVTEKVVAALLPNDTFECICLPLEKDGPEPIGKEAITAQMKDALSAARKEVADAEYYVCMEGSMLDDGVAMNEVAYVTVEDSHGTSMTSSCSSFPVPTAVAAQVREGKGFAEAVDEFYKTTGTKQGGGFVNILTNGVINKKDHYFQPLTIALSALIRKDWFV